MKQLFLLTMVLFSLSSSAYSLPIQLLTLPPHFSIAVYADQIDDAREMTLGTNNIVFVGSRGAGKVYAIVPDKNKAMGSRVLTIASGLHQPNGVAFYQGNLYVAETNRIIRFDAIENHLEHPPKPQIITTDIPDEGGHDWHYIRFGDDNKLYIGMGAPCNACLEEDPRFATIMRMDADGRHLEIYARGVRNTVGFDWHPQTHQLWFTDNGRDWLGDNAPPDELNVAIKPGLHFGFPYCHGKNIADPTYGKMFACSAFVPPVLELPAHVAALGMTFYRGKLFPAEYQHAIFIAEHGSWNRSSKAGYQVVAVKLNGSQITNVSPFVSGWLHHGRVWGRPVDTLEMVDGSLLISDDKANAIYRVSYK